MSPTRPSEHLPDAPTHHHGRRPPATRGGTAPVVVPAGRPSRGQGVGVVVPAGGTSRRFGADKLAADLGGRPLLAVTLEGVRAALPGAPVVVVGPRERAPLPGTDARVVREEPAGAGPAAAVLAGARALPAHVDVVAVAPGDAPFSGSALPVLVDAVRAGARAAVAVDPDGRRQHLLLALRTDHLVGLDPTALVDAPARALLAGVPDALVVEVVVDARSTVDVDDPAALVRARAAADAAEQGDAAPAG